MFWCGEINGYMIYEDCSGCDRWGECEKKPLQNKNAHKRRFDEVDDEEDYYNNKNDNLLYHENRDKIADFYDLL